MAEKNIEEVKTKLIIKLYKIRSKHSAYKTYKRFQKSTKQIKTLERKFESLIKRSKNTLVIGRNDNFTDITILDLRKLSVEDLKNL